MSGIWNMQNINTRIGGQCYVFLSTQTGMAQLLNRINTYTFDAAAWRTDSRNFSVISGGTREVALYRKNYCRSTIFEKTDKIVESCHNSSIHLEYSSTRSDTIRRQCLEFIDISCQWWLDISSTDIGPIFFITEYSILMVSKKMVSSYWIKTPLVYVSNISVPFFSNSNKCKNNYCCLF